MRGGNPRRDGGVIYIRFQTPRCSNDRAHYHPPSARESAIGSLDAWAGEGGLCPRRSERNALVPRGEVLKAETHRTRIPRRHHDARCLNKRTVITQLWSTATGLPGTWGFRYHQGVIANFRTASIHDDAIGVPAALEEGAVDANQSYCQRPQPRIRLG